MMRVRGELCHSLWDREQVEVLWLYLGYIRAGGAVMFDLQTGGGVRGVVEAPPRRSALLLLCLYVQRPRSE